MKISAFNEIIDLLVATGLSELDAIYLVARLLEEKKVELKEDVINELGLKAKLN
ncbi:MAG: hypothetical protein GX769_01330 [Erysipelothrix sp.]|nr:hypothetical protein [Erysipelothrix sp.]